MAEVKLLVLTEVLARSVVKVFAAVTVAAAWVTAAAADVAVVVEAWLVGEATAPLLPLLKAAMTAKPATAPNTIFWVMAPLAPDVAAPAPAPTVWAWTEKCTLVIKATATRVEIFLAVMAFLGSILKRWFIKA